MKRLLYLTLCAALLLGTVVYAVDANATGYPPAPDPKPATTQTSTSKATAGAVAGAKAGANAKGGAAQAKGGSADAASDNDTSIGGDHNKSDFLAIALPAPVFVAPLPVLPATTCAEAFGRAHALGWNFASEGENGINPDKCIAIEIYNAHVKGCRYASAKQVLDLLTVKILAGFKPVDQTLLDLSAIECTALNAPPKAAPASYFLLPPEEKKAPAVRRVVAAGDDPCNSPTAKSCTAKRKLIVVK